MNFVLLDMFRCAPIRGAQGFLRASMHICFHAYMHICIYARREQSPREVAPSRSQNVVAARPGGGTTGFDIQEVPRNGARPPTKTNETRPSCAHTMERTHSTPCNVNTNHVDQLFALSRMSHSHDARNLRFYRGPSAAGCVSPFKHFNNLKRNCK